MIDFKKLFAAEGFGEARKNGRTVYAKEGADHYFLLEVTPDSYIVHVYFNDAPKKSRELYVYRVSSDDWVSREFEKILHNYERMGDAFFEPNGLYARRADSIRHLIGYHFTESEWEILCKLYTFSLCAGGAANILSETILEVIHIMQIPEDKYVTPRLHQLLLDIPDTYYDFIIGVENNLSTKPAEQERLMNLIINHHIIDSCEVILAVSLMTARKGVFDREIFKTIEIFRKNQIFSGKGMEDLDGEVTQFMDKIGWKITTFFIDDTGYTIRHSGPVILIDFADSCIGGAVLEQTEEGVATITVLHIDDRPANIPISDKLLAYIERVCKHAGMKELHGPFRSANVELYENRGYEKMDGYYRLIIK